MRSSVGQGTGLGAALSQDVPAWLMHQFLASYVAWRDEAAEVQDAYDDWSAARDSDAAAAFLGYRAALEREEQAAGVLRGWAERISGPEETSRAV
jgi:hypothetical protein